MFVFGVSSDHAWPRTPSHIAIIYEWCWTSFFDTPSVVEMKGLAWVEHGYMAV